MQGIAGHALLISNGKAQNEVEGKSHDQCVLEGTQG
jgi:hypothetical protein